MPWALGVSRAVAETGCSMTRLRSPAKGQAPAQGSREWLAVPQVRARAPAAERRAAYLRRERHLRPERFPSREAERPEAARSGQKELEESAAPRPRSPLLSALGSCFS